MTLIRERRANIENCLNGGGLIVRYLSAQVHSAVREPLTSTICDVVRGGSANS